MVSEELKATKYTENYKKQNLSTEIFTTIPIESESSSILNKMLTTEKSIIN